MPHPTINYSLEEIEEEALKTIVWLEEVIAKHPRWGWPPLVLVLAREFQALATQKPLDLARIRDFENRLKDHIIVHRLKGFDPFIWRAEALQYLAETQ